MRYNKIFFNDVANAPGVTVSIFLQGCPHHCKGCFNPETWDFNGGQEFTYQTLETIIESLNKNNIRRSLCILGGEPLCAENIFTTYLITDTVKRKMLDTKIYTWTGYTYEELLDLAKFDSKLHKLISGEMIDCIIDGPYIESLRDITLPMRGSSNQRIIELN